MAEESGIAKRATSSITLNDLPEELLLQILERLPLIYAVRATLISRKWRNLWHFMPSLKLALDDDFPLFTPRITAIRSSFTDFVNLALLHRPTTIPLKKFRFFFLYSHHHRYRSLVTSWIRYALRCGVNDVWLDFDFRPLKLQAVISNDDEEEEDEEEGDEQEGDEEEGEEEDEEGEEEIEEQRYVFHFLDLRNSSVGVLRVYGCAVVVPEMISTGFGSLRSLTLGNVDVSDEMLYNMISMCENLENLSLSGGGFRGVRHFRIHSESLKVLKLLNYFPSTTEEMKSSSVELRLPNVCSITIIYFTVGEYNVINLSSVLEAEIDVHYGLEFQFKIWSNLINLLYGVKSLKVQNNWLKFTNAKIQSGEDFEFLNLKHLELKSGYTCDDIGGICAILAHSPRVETCVIDYFYRAKKDASCINEFWTRPIFLNMMPCVKEVTMKHFRSTDAEFLLLWLMIGGMGDLKKVIMCPAHCEDKRSITFDVVNFRQQNSESWQAQAERFRSLSGQIKSLP